MLSRTGLPIKGPRFSLYPAHRLTNAITRQRDALTIPVASHYQLQVVRYGYQKGTGVCGRGVFRPFIP
jgi:hypothetical protein